MRARVQLDETGLICGRRFVAAQKTHYTPPAIAVDEPERVRSGERTDLRVVLVAVSVMVAGLLVATMVAAPDSFFSAGTETGLSATADTTAVTGKVWYMGEVVVGASVTVSMYDGGELRSSDSDVTDSLGEYWVTFSNAPMSSLPWAVGDTIIVVAEHDSLEGSNSDIAEDSIMHEIDVTLGTVIPEFGDLGAIAPVAGVLGMFMAFFFARKRKDA